MFRLTATRGNDSQVSGVTSLRSCWPHLGLEIAERRVLLAAGDLVFLNLALFLVLAGRGQFALGLQSVWLLLPWFLLLSLVWGIVALYGDVYDLARAAVPLHSIWAAGGCVFITGVVYVLIPFITPGLPQRRLEIAIFASVAVLGVCGWRLLYASVLAQPQFHRTALIVGAGTKGRALARTVAELQDKPGNPIRGTGYRILGFLDDDPAKQGRTFEQVPVLGTHADMVRLVHILAPDELILAITQSQQSQPDLTQAIIDCQQMGVAMTTMPSLFERMRERVPIDHAGQDLQDVLPMERPAIFRFYRFIHRLLDLAIAVAGCLSLLAVIPCIWLANCVLSPGDLFYRQIRIGQGGKPFCVVKFRSMVMDAEARTGATWASPNDPRVTRVGCFLRRTRLDEAPQFWNILAGEMSLIGPRPERPEFVSAFAQSIPFYRSRHAVRPGLTGWAQVKCGYCATEEEARLKLEYDLYYIKHQGFFLDFLIIVKTVQVILGLAGR